MGEVDVAFVVPDGCIWDVLGNPQSTAKVACRGRGRMQQQIMLVRKDTRILQARFLEPSKQNLMRRELAGEEMAAAMKAQTSLIITLLSAAKRLVKQR